MGIDIFDNLIGNFNGYALENLKEGNPNPALDTTNFDNFFSDNFGDIQPEQITKSRRVLRKRTKKMFKKFRTVARKEATAFGGF